MHVIEHANGAELTTVVATRLAAVTRAAISEAGRARLALAGGSTPMPIYRALAAMALDWPKIELLPGDERWVAHEHKACNLAAIQREFGDVPAIFHALVPPRPGPEPNLKTAHASLASIGDGFDACLLGMGGDGHFASLFPGTANLAQGLDSDNPESVIVVHPDPLPTEAPFARISLTLAAIARCPMLLLAIRGEAKRRVLEQAATGHTPKLPITALLTAVSDRLEIHWSP
ncbi:MAG: 6-phosphogluconolactonase [Wenzhouxiangellaceae bacterium]|nr:6-phosphogluconolactonase [Wenzhouxiangellaceae bacterium]